MLLAYKDIEELKPIDAWLTNRFFKYFFPNKI